MDAIRGNERQRQLSRIDVTGGESAALVNMDSTSPAVAVCDGTTGGKSPVARRRGKWAMRLTEPEPLGERIGDSVRVVPAKSQSAGFAGALQPQAAMNH